MDRQTTEAPEPTIARVAVVGAGTMGRQIATLVAGADYDVTLHDADPDALAGAVPLAREEMRTPAAPPEYRHHQHRLPVPADPEAVLGRIRPTPTLAEATAGADLVIEAIREEIGAKRTLFAELDRLIPAAILATNSSSLPSSLLVPAVADPGRLLNMHFFSPIRIRPMLEVMGCGRTRPETLAAAARFGRSLGLTTAVVRGESKGFIINRVWRAVKREALRVVDEGHADPEDVDRLWMLFFGTGIGPFGIMDGVGLDVVADIEASYAAVATDPEDRASPILRGLLDRGRLGEKSGEGFYRYPDPAFLAADWLEADEPAPVDPSVPAEAGPGDPASARPTPSRT